MIFGLPTLKVEHLLFVVQTDSVSRNSKGCRQVAR